MTSVVEIEKAVAELPPADLAAFRAWFERFDGGQLDRRIEEDVARGQLDRLADEALAEKRSGRVREL